MKHLINGLLYLQKESKFIIYIEIIHRDIKPANILVSEGIPKFADFGFSMTNLH